MSKLTHDSLQHRLDALLKWCRERSYAGHSKHDALNSRFLWACSLGIPFLRLVITQVIMRFPLNLRTIFGVPTLRNPKGIGLFAHTYFQLADMADSEEKKATYTAEAERLMAWLVHHASPNAPASEGLKDTFQHEGDAMPALAEDTLLKGLGWGYHYPWQDQGFFQPRHYPNRVVTSWIGFAVVRAYQVTGKQVYLDVCKEIAVFLTENPRILFEDEGSMCLSYVPLDDIEWAVMDVSSLVASFLAQYAACLPTEQAEERTRLASLARRLMAFVVDKQTDYGAWFYTWPAKDSHIQHDNYHTGIILDCLADYMTNTGDQEWEDVYRKGLAYYQEALFTPEGAPRWMNNTTYPFDTHGAASGALCFIRAATYWKHQAKTPLEHEDTSAQEQADRILSWTLSNLSAPDGSFFYQKTRWLTKRFSLMRWCNAWMSRALVERIRLNT